MKSLLLFFLLLPALCAGQLSKRDSLWLPFKHFIGEWTGTSEGEPGNGKYERSYRFMFHKQYIEIKNKSTYPPTQANTHGEVHEDVGYISFDKINKTFKLRQFHVEGFVNQYKMESISEDGKIIVFVSESIENIPAGWRAKEIYQFNNDTEVTELFELASPGKDYALYSKAILKKKE